MYKPFLCMIIIMIMTTACLNLSRTDQTDKSSVDATPISWESTGILINPKSDDNHTAVSIKDPTVVYYKGKWHIYATIYDTKANTYNMVYLSFSDWSEAESATMYYMDSNPGFRGYKCAPQVFYFAPQKKWYLIFQSQPPTYSTAAEIGEPSNWSAPKEFYRSKPRGAPNLWIDYWVICDSENAYLFFSGDDGRLYRSRTTLKDFPGGFGEVTTVMEFPLQRDLFEACNVYKIKGTDKYLLLNECADGNWTRYFKAFISDSLTGTWYELAASDANPFFGQANVTFADGVSPWTKDFSHGELIRAGYDQTMMINEKNLQFLYQGKTGNASSYDLIPWSLGMLNQVGSPHAKSIFDVDLAGLKPYTRTVVEKKEIPGAEGDTNVMVVELESLADQPGFAPFAVIDDADASGGKAIEWPEEEGEQHVAAPSDNEPGQAAISFTLPETATVEFQMQVNMANGDDDSFYYKMDSGDWNTQNNSGTNGYQIITVNTYKDLAAGKHTLKILRRENGAKLDKVIFKSSVPLTADVLYANFENNQVDGWTGRGSATLTIADKGAYQGNYCLLTTKRSAGWNGPQIDLTGKILLTGIYKISAWVKILEGEPAGEMIITMQRDKSGKSSWDRVLAQQVESNAWVNLIGDYEVKNDFDKIAMYIESSNPTLSYYIDEIKVTVIKQPAAAGIKAKNNFLATAKKGTPVIDGKEDAVWATAPVNNITIYAMGSGAKGTGQVLWDEEGVYVFIKVQDSELSKVSVNTYEQDSVEIFIDEQNDKTVDYAEDDAQYRISYENDQSSSAGFPGKIVSATVVTGTGYDVEAFIPFKSIKGTPGTKIGFDLQINDGDSSGKRTSIAKWNDPTNDTYRNTSNFGTLVLSE